MRASGFRRLSCCRLPLGRHRLKNLNICADHLSSFLYWFGSRFVWPVLGGVVGTGSGPGKGGNKRGRTCGGFVGHLLPSAAF